MPAVKHGSFTLERRYRAPVARTYAAWCDVETKARWFIGPGAWQPLRRELDLRVGGHELMVGAFPDGPTTRYEGRYHVIAPEQQLLFVYDLYLDDVLHSLALVSVTFAPTPDGGTHMVFTESTAYMDGTDQTEGRIQGTTDHLDRLATVLDGVALPVGSAHVCGQA